MQNLTGGMIFEWPEFVVKVQTNPKNTELYRKKIYQKNRKLQQISNLELCFLALRSPPQPQYYRFIENIWINLMV